MKLLWWILLLPVIAIVSAFAVANRGGVNIDLDPLPYAFEIPLYAALMVAVLNGLFVGGISAWLAGGGKRREARLLRKDKKMLESEIDGLRARLAAPIDEPQTGDDGDTSPKVAIASQVS